MDLAAFIEKKKAQESVLSAKGWQDFTNTAGWQEFKHHMEVALLETYDDLVVALPEFMPVLQGRAQNLTELIEFPDIQAEIKAIEEDEEDDS